MKKSNLNLDFIFKGALDKLVVSHTLSLSLLNRYPQGLQRFHHCTQLSTNDFDFLIYWDAGNIASNRSATRHSQRLSCFSTSNRYRLKFSNKAPKEKTSSTYYRRCGFVLFAYEYCRKLSSLTDCKCILSTSVNIPSYSFMTVPPTSPQFVSPHSRLFGTLFLFQLGSCSTKARSLMK